jgi:hypothetical protein
VKRVATAILLLATIQADAGIVAETRVLSAISFFVLGGCLAGCLEQEENGDADVAVVGDNKVHPVPA